MVYFNIYILIVISVHCGGSYRDFEKKIIDGKDVSINNYPHAVFLEILTNDSRYICGSSILNQYYLITAAHCVHDERYNNIRSEINAFAGHENIKKALAFRNVKRVIIHKKYSPMTIHNDIALLLLTKELPLGESIKRIILRPSFPSDARGTLTGWGILNELTEEESITLKSITQTVKSRRRCNIVGITRSSFCAGSYNESSPRAAPSNLRMLLARMYCINTRFSSPNLLFAEDRHIKISGDSGSGLVSSKYQLLGLVSFKLTSYPALPVYTNASYYYSWITKNAKIALCRSL